MYLRFDDGSYGYCNKTGYEYCEHIVKTCQLESFSTNRAYTIISQNLSSASKNMVYLFSSKPVQKIQWRHRIWR